MKNLFMFFLCITLLIFSACAEKVDTKVDVEAINSLLEELTTARKTLNAEEVVAFWTDDCVLMMPNELKKIGKDEIKAFLQLFYDQVNVKELSIKADEVIVCGDWAFIQEKFKATWLPKDGSEPLYQDSKGIMILQRQPNNTWKISRVALNHNPS